MAHGPRARPPPRQPRALTALRRARAGAQLLHRPFDLPPDELVGRLLAVQAQDLSAARLALRARSAAVSVEAVERALADERSLVAGWLMRGTLHLVHAEDYAWLLGLTAPARLTANARRLRQEGVSEAAAERAVAAIEHALADEGPLTRAELAERVAARDVPTAGQAMPHLLGLAAFRGIALLGPLRPDGAHAFALARDRLPGGAPTPALAGEERERALGELARRYLSAHGPASAADLASWSGVPLRDARAGLDAIAAELADAGGPGLVDLAGREAPRRGVPPRLLPAFDPYLLGWKDRSFCVPPAYARAVHPGGGMLRAVATDDGLAIGTWTGRGKVKLELFDGSPVPARGRLAEEIAAVEAFSS